MAMEKQDFKHVTQLRVRSYEVDWQGIVHNSNYLRYFEVGRIEYLKHIGATVDMNSIQGDHKVVLVRHEIDFALPARFDELLNVYTRVSFIRNSSFAMEGLMESAESSSVIARTVAFHVWLDPVTDRPRTIGDEFRRLVQQYEGTKCNILWPSIEV
jgi:acyl-CoA thioester hydrolase